MRIYTRSGDSGMTSIRGGKKVPKTDIRIGTNGTIDELNSYIGLLRKELYDNNNKELADYLKGVQCDLMSAMSIIATPYDERSHNPRSIPETRIAEFEQIIDLIQEGGFITQHFVLPSGCTEAVLSHIARSICRRAERMLWKSNEVGKVDDKVVIYLNRLSDLFFALARFFNGTSGCYNEIWEPFKSIR